MHMIEASLEFGLHFWALKFQFSQWYRIFKLGLLPNNDGQEPYYNLT